MVSDTDAFDPDRPRGIFSKRDRKYLLGALDVEPRSQKDRDIRANLRKRMRAALLDFVLLYEYVEDRDIEQALGEPSTPFGLVERNRSISRMLAVIFDLATEDGGTDTRQLEGYLQDAVKASVQKRQAGEDAVAVRLGEPDVSIDVDLPEEIDVEALDNKVEAIRQRLADYDLDGSEDRKHYGQLAGRVLGLDSLSPSEVMLLYAQRESQGPNDTIDPVLKAWTRWYWRAGERSGKSWFVGRSKIGLFDDPGSGGKDNQDQDLE